MREEERHLVTTHLTGDLWARAYRLAEERGLDFDDMIARLVAGGIELEERGHEREPDRGSLSDLLRFYGAVFVIAVLIISALWAASGGRGP